MVRRVWIGDPPMDLLENQLAIYGQRGERRKLGGNTPEWAAPRMLPALRVKLRALAGKPGASRG
jgi:hypothetical protein